MMVHPDRIETKFLGTNAKAGYFVGVRYAKIIGNNKAVSHMVKFFSDPSVGYNACLGEIEVF